MAFTAYLPDIGIKVSKPEVQVDDDIISDDLYHQHYEHGQTRLLNKQEKDQLFNYLVNMQNKHIGGYYSWVAALPVCIFLSAMMFVMSYNCSWQMVYQSGSFIELFNYYELYSMGLLSLSEFSGYLLHLVSEVAVIGVGAVLVSQFRHFLVLMYSNITSTTVSVLSCMYGMVIFYMAYMAVF
jgi:hypothetical protein